QARQSNSVDLDKARLVVSVGRGIGSKENISLAEALCQTIGADHVLDLPGDPHCQIQFRFEHQVGDTDVALVLHPLLVFRHR
ncbi:FAD-binding protein, partial [Salmonella enterica subsp. enterica serovar Mbandaka]|nr:FAD-binding protein [Salmonella enterica subsp. enterica serovar Mbandaka]